MHILFIVWKLDKGKKLFDKFIDFSTINYRFRFGSILSQDSGWAEPHQYYLFQAVYIQTLPLFWLGKDLESKSKFFRHLFCFAWPPFWNIDFGHLNLRKAMIICNKFLLNTNPEAGSHGHGSSLPVRSQCFKWSHQEGNQIVPETRGQFHKPLTPFLAF